MKSDSAKVLLLFGTIFVFDEFARTTWKLIESEMGKSEAGWLGLLIVIVSSAVLYSARKQLHSLSDSAVGWIIPTIFDSQLHPPVQSRLERLSLSLFVSLAALSSATGIAWVTDALEMDHEWIVVAGCAAAVIGLFGIKRSYARTHFRLVRREIAADFETLVMFLSDNRYITGSPPRHSVPTKIAGFPSEDAIKDAFRRAPDEFHDNWLMPVLSIRHQAARDRLRRVLVIPSVKSANQWEAFEELINAWFPNRQFALEKVGSGADFTALEEVWGRVNEAFTIAGNDGGSKVVDITGGLALCSVAGAIASLEPGRVFKYVDTNTYHQHGFMISHAIEQGELGE